MPMEKNGGIKHWSGQYLGEQIGKSRIITSLILAMVIATSILILTIRVVGDDVEVAEGEKLPQTIYSRIDFRVEDPERSRKMGDEAAEKVPLYYCLDDTQKTQTLENLNSLESELKERLKEEKAGKTYSVQERAGNAPSGTVKLVAALSPEAAGVFRTAWEHGFLEKCFEAWRDLVRKGILSESGVPQGSADRRIIVFGSFGERANSLPRTAFYSLPGIAFRAADDLLFDRIRPDEKIRAELAGLFSGVLTDNLAYDEAETARRRDLARADAKYFREIVEGQVLFRKGHVIQERDRKLYEKYLESLEDRYGSRLTWLSIVKKIALTAGLMFFICLYIYHIHPEVVRSNRSIWLLAGITVLALLLDRIFAGFFLICSDRWGIQPMLIFLALPLALPALLVSVIYGLRSAIYVGLFSSGIAAIALNNSFPAFVTGLLLSGIAGFSVRHTMDYKKFFTRAFLSCMVTTFFAGAVFMGDRLLREEPESSPEKIFPAVSPGSAPSVLSGEGLRIFKPGTRELDPHFEARARSLAIGLIGIPFTAGLATALSALVILFLLESLFGIATNMSYLTFTDRNHSLLKNLQLDAPGTYHHSERVASISEKAAAEIGVNLMKVQACALFHDVGKLKYPAMFTENFKDGEVNPHNGLSPQESANFIKQHVSYGLELAKKHNLLPLIRQTIQTHHGTDFISFFYEQAKKEDLTGLHEEDFRYNGPLPAAKEIVLVMLADCTEAAVRSLDSPSPESIRAMVESVFEKKLHNGQLDNAELSLKELHLIREAFINTMIAMNHGRIAYPKTGQRTTA